MNIKEYYRHLYKKEWEDYDSNRKLVFKKEGDQSEEKRETDRQTPKKTEEKKHPLRRKLLYYGFYFTLPILLIPVALLLFDFVGSAVIVLVSDMGLYSKVMLITIQSIFSILVVISLTIIIQWFLARQKN